MTAPAGTGRAVVSRQVRQSPGERSRAPGGDAAHCPGRPLRAQGHPKILSNRSAESIFGIHPCARSLYRPCGPDGEGQAKGQARGARGETPQVDLVPVEYDGSNVVSDSAIMCDIRRIN
jgi:hypothetical protein